MATKKEPRQFSDFLKISLAVMVEIVDLALKAVVYSSEIHTLRKIYVFFNYILYFIFFMAIST